MFRNDLTRYLLLNSRCRKLVNPLRVTFYALRSTLYALPVFLLFTCVFSIFCLPGCSKSKQDSESVSQVLSQKLYLRSQQELAQGEYEKAYNDYQRAVEADPDVADVSHLSSIIYGWVISESDGEDVPHITAQKRVWLEPEQLALRRGLLSLALDMEKDTIHAFGLGLAPADASSAAQREFLARKAALADAQAWTARVAIWGKTGVECPFNVPQTTVNVEILKEYWVGDTVYVVKVKAPIDCLS